MALFDFVRSKRYHVEEIQSPKTSHREDEVLSPKYHINMATLQDNINYTNNINSNVNSNIPQMPEKPHLQQQSKAFDDGRHFPPPPTLLQKIGAEVVSTFILIFVSCGLVMVHEENKGALTQLGIWIATGTVVAMMIYSVGHISGAHMNPAVSLAFASKGCLPWSQVPPYVISQISASICACFTLQQVFGTSTKVALTVPAGSNIQALLTETIITFILMFVVTATSIDNHAVGELGGFVVAGTVLTNNLLAGIITGASMNPARSLGPAIASGTYTSLWIYCIAPPIGALIGIWTHHFIFVAPSNQAALQFSTSIEK